MNKERPEYLSYLLRLWRENDDQEAHDAEAAVWRASLERPQAGERRGFANLADLFAFLEHETKSSSPGPERPETKGGDKSNGPQTARRRARSTELG